MASTYTKEGSKWIWLRYKDETGKWRGKQLAYRRDNIGDQRQAERVALKQSEIEAAREPASGHRLKDWVLGWILATWGNSDTSTPDTYKRQWRTVERFLEAQQILTAAQITREHIQIYLHWRTTPATKKERTAPKAKPRKAASRNMAIQEIKFLGKVLKEAKERKQIDANPFSKPGLKRDPEKEKIPWTDENIAAGAKYFSRKPSRWDSNGPSRWMRCTFFFGLYQACRLRQCQLPLTAIRLDLDVIQYPPQLVKGRKGYSQPIDPRFRPILEQLVEEAKRAGEKTICTIPWDASIRLRRALDRAGLPDLVHHGLRVTWITRAAENGVPERQAMAFCHHESKEVHRIYVKLSVVGIAHVPSLMQLPSFSLAGDVIATKQKNASPSSRSRTRKHSPDPSHHRPAGDRSRETAQGP